MDKKTLFLILSQVLATAAMKNVIFAVNAGGDLHVDSYGVEYQKDPLQNEGIGSDYGMRLASVGRVNPEDDILYRTERYSLNTFGYDIPIKSDGEYVLVLKFCEVYFGSRGAKVFDVLLNKDHLVVPQLDIYAKVGLGVAHDEIIPFKVSNGAKKLMVSGSESVIKNGKILLQFAKGRLDNPKVNAFYVIKGTIDDVPQLPSQEDFLFEEEEDVEESVLPMLSTKSKLRRQATQRDPWEDEPLLTVYLPVLGAFGASCLATLFVFTILK